MSDINILVVDDEKEIADLIEIYLVSDGYKVFKAENAAKGLEILAREEVHLVLLDIMMPGMNGLEMCKKIRETNNIPIIMLSAKSTDLDKILGLGTGADDYVVKPFNPLELTARVKSQLRRYTQLNPNSAARERANNEITIKSLTGRRSSLLRLNLTFFICWPLIRERCSVPMRFLNGCGTRRYTRPTIPLWYISDV